MSTIQQVYQQAELAEAAYSNFFDESGKFLVDIEKIKVALQNGGKGMSESQASAFLDRYRPIHQLPDTGNGFSASVFESGARHVLAIRGSTPAQYALDFLEDGALIVNTGIALDQAIDLYNYWKSLNTQEGGIYEAAILVPVENYGSVKNLTRRKLAGRRGRNHASLRGMASASYVHGIDAKMH